MTGVEADRLYISLTSPYYCPALETLALEDIMGPGRRGQYCSALVAVRSLKPEIMTNGRKVKEVRIFDDNAHTAVLKLWEMEQLRMATEWESRDTILLISNVLIEFDKYWQVNVLSGSSRTVITVNPNILDAAILRDFAQSAAFSSTQRLETFVAGTVPSVATRTSKLVTVADIREMSAAGASSEATALLYVSVLAKMTFKNILDESCVTACCRGCGWQLVEFGDTTDCDNFDCTITPASRLPVYKYTMTAEILDPTGPLTDLRVYENFLVELLSGPESWPTQPMRVKKNTRRLLSNFTQIFLALELPLPSQARPLRAMIISAIYEA